MRRGEKGIPVACIGCIDTLERMFECVRVQIRWLIDRYRVEIKETERDGVCAILYDYMQCH